MKRMMIISMALLFGGALLAQTSDRKPDYPFANCIQQNMVPDGVTAKPFPKPWYLIPVNPYMSPGKPEAHAVIEKMKVDAIPGFKDAGRVVVNMNPQ
jgi:hypothetical protein